MEDICEICGQPLDDNNSSRCALCGRRFHMAWSVNAEVQQCGQIWFDPISGGMGFVCNICVDEHPEMGNFIFNTELPPQ